MSKIKCPRCHEMWPSELYQYPLSICLVCYARIPANNGLSLNELKVKATKSWRATARVRKEDAKGLGAAFLARHRDTMVTRCFEGYTTEQIDALSQEEKNDSACSRCSTFSHDNAVTYYQGDNIVLCPSCLARDGLHLPAKMQEDEEAIPMDPKYRKSGDAYDVLRMLDKKHE